MTASSEAVGTPPLADDQFEDVSHDPPPGLVQL